ncbi:MAG: hypothetical protein ABJA64_01505 [Candidatus Saccharibacteria bacterium]
MANIKPKPSLEGAHEHRFVKSTTHLLTKPSSDWLKKQLRTIQTTKKPLELVREFTLYVQKFEVVVTQTKDGQHILEEHEDMVASGEPRELFAKKGLVMRLLPESAGALMTGMLDVTNSNDTYEVQALFNKKDGVKLRRIGNHG